jgi:membrane protein implicated in regulation of membrane protease activity
MEEYLAWVIIGLALVIVELLTGTFYLVMLGIAAFGAALAAWLGQGFPLQAIVAAAIAALGCYGVHVYRARNMTQQMPQVDAGQPANFENWVDRGARLARVSYRGASWDALVEGEESPAAGAILYVLATHGNTLKVTTRRPA